MRQRPTPPSPARKRWIDDWRPDDPAFWRQGGRRTALRNLLVSMTTQHLGFAVWLLWSEVAVSLPAAGFHFTVDQLLWLTALPSLLGSGLRLPYTFAVTRFGGRTWTAASAALLLIPTALLAACVSNSGTPYWMFLAASATAGLGGANFASSMAHVSFLYPGKHRGLALGINAAGGNLGVAVVQLAVPPVITATTGIHLAWAGLMWIPLIIATATAALLWTDNFTEANTNPRAYKEVLSHKDTWLTSALYLGTFGSFIGFSAALPLLIQTQFPEAHASYFAFLGALTGSAARPVGGWLADEHGGGKVTIAALTGVIAGVVAVIEALAEHSFALFLAAFLWLFITTGIGNGSTYQLIPRLYPTKQQSAAAIGIIGAIGGLGGFLITSAFAASLHDGGGLTPALTICCAYYAACLAITAKRFRRS
ncbi:hypothetical protein UK23_23575 [Lentzea aerocolonigenes]|uniref:Nitrate transporter n=1 Tax=Lentzea aerocolonigenes TaxID=68170 RepID=A0A0F0GYA1_LENAE|nr:hypothetical protein UK23_23575 [Lentzea aerocolonigenes]